MIPALLINPWRAKGFLNISPLLADCLYPTRQMIWYVHDVGSSPDIEKLIDDNTETLQMLRRKWEVASKCLFLGLSTKLLI